MAKDLTEEIRRITNEIAANAAAKALEVSNAAAAKVSEVATAATAEAARVSTMAIAKALDASTLAAEKAAQAAVAAAQVASATSLDLTYIKKDIADTKADIKEIMAKLDDKYVTKVDFNLLKTTVEKHEDKLDGHTTTLDQFATVKAIVFGMVGLILTSVMGGLMYLLLNK